MENERESFVRETLEKEGHEVKRITKLGFPDYLIDDNFYVEVKNADLLAVGVATLSSYQERQFKNKNLPIKIYYVALKEKKILIENFVSKDNIKIMKKINVIFGDDEHKNIDDLKKEFNLNWHDFILILADHARASIKKGDLKVIVK